MTETVEIPLTRGHVCIVDRADYEAFNLQDYKWEAQKSGHKFYALHRKQRNKKVERLLMHRIIMEPGDLQQIDHINGNGLDNRRSNLRICDARHNAANKHVVWGESKFRGVWKRGDKWESALRWKDEKHQLGVFDNEVDAAIAFDKKLMSLAGEFANTNLPVELYTGGCSSVIVPMEPSEGMVKCGALAMSSITQEKEPVSAAIFGQPRDVYQAMIKAALEEE